MIKTTVVIPNYNGIKYMEDCLTFLSRCKETEFATIVVDNGSSDGSRELVAEKFPWVELIVNEENLGFCKAVNQGIRASRTPYVLLLNNDTVVDDRFVANLEKSMDARPGYFSISAKMLSMKEPEIIDDAGDFYCALGWAFARGKGMDSGRYTEPSKIFAACGGAAIYRRDVFAKIGKPFCVSGGYRYRLSCKDIWVSERLLPGCDRLPCGKRRKRIEIQRVQGGSLLSQQYLSDL